MSTQKESLDFILEKLEESPHMRDPAKGGGRFAVRAMFGEYALYADRKVVGLICNDQLYVKILPALSLASDGARVSELEDICEKDEAYPGSKKFYVVEEGELSKLPNLPDILLTIAKSLPAKKDKKKKSPRKSK